MQPFSYSRPRSVSEATRTPGTFLAGGTTLVDLMKLEVLTPHHVLDVAGIAEISSQVVVAGNLLTLGARATMADTMANRELQARCPLITQSLALAASPQIRNMATLGGNVLQKTRCTYYRGVDWPACNKRTPGSGCTALQAPHRQHAVLGVSPQCMATYHGDFAQALLALDAEARIIGASGARAIPFRELHVRPERDAFMEHRLAPGELISAFRVQLQPWFRRSHYVKVRDRQSYEFAAASVAVALNLRGGEIVEARVALGGVATVPWRARAAETWLAGKRLDEKVAEEAGERAFFDARPLRDNAYKVPLGRQAVARALLELASMEPPA